MANRDSPNNTPQKDSSKGSAPSEKKGFWKRKFTGGNAGKSIKDGFTLVRFVAFLLLAVAIISYVHGAESPPTLMSLFDVLKYAPRVRIDILNIPKIDFGTGVVVDTVERAINALISFINLGNVGAVAIYNLLTFIWYFIAYVTIF